MGDLRPRMPGDAADKPRLTWFDFVVTAVALIVGQIDELVGASSSGLLGRSIASEVVTLAGGLALLARRRWPWSRRSSWRPAICSRSPRSRSR